MLNIRFSFDFSHKGGCMSISDLYITTFTYNILPYYIPIDSCFFGEPLLSCPDPLMTPSPGHLPDPGGTHEGAVYTRYKVRHGGRLQPPLHFHWKVAAAQSFCFAGESRDEACGNYRL